MGLDFLETYGQQNKYKPYKGPWHSFYSATCIERLENYYYTDEEKKQKNYIDIHTNFYRKKDSDEEVEITAIFSIEKFPNYMDCEYYFDDKIYLGIVDKWLKTGQKTILCK